MKVLPPLEIEPATSNAGGMEGTIGRLGCSSQPRVWGGNPFEQILRNANPVVPNQQATVQSTIRLPDLLFKPSRQRLIMHLVTLPKHHSWLVQIQLLMYPWRVLS